LIILMIIFTGKTNKLEGGLSDCEGKGGVCASTSGTGFCPTYTLESSAFTCSQGYKCCIGTPKKVTANSDCGPDSTQGEKGYCYPK
ncbi:MAG: hypothetical protein AABX04_00850, partial [Nanoarchaeota archaeon]